MKKTLMVSIGLFAIASMAMAQTITIKTFGHSPRDVALERVDTALNTPYNGLTNVGIGSRVYLKGSFGDSTFSGAAWTITPPATSTLTSVHADSISTIDTATQIIRIRPDIVGSYTVTLTQGGLSASIVITAAKYLGNDNGLSCSSCHQDLFAKWQGTHHSDALERKLDGLSGTYFQSYCVSCHSTGYDADPLAVNDGFDDFSFTFPDSTAIATYAGVPGGALFVGLFDALAADYPDAFERANIQCESCHGPGSEHKATLDPALMAISTATATCAYCHDSGTHHVFPEQWDQTGHSNPPSYPTGAGRSSCARCHTPDGFIQMTKGESVTEHEWAPFSCAMCHEPHDATNNHQLRKVTATLANGFEITQGGNGKLCMNCHQSRKDGSSYPESQLGKDASHFGPHYMTQADIINSQNVITFGQVLPHTPHVTATEDACATCHMSSLPGKVDADGYPQKLGGHSLNMSYIDTSATPDVEVFHVEVCAPCHGDVGDSFAEKLYYDDTENADHDGDGTAEGVQEEVHGLLDMLADILPANPDESVFDSHSDPKATWTLTEVQAAFNYKMIYYDRSYGIHNPAFIVATLKTTIKALENATIASDDIVAIDDVPNDQGKMVRIIWRKNINDGPYIIKRLDQYVNADTTWTTVATLAGDGSQRYAIEVPTLYNGVAASFMVKVGEHESIAASGTSVDNLIPAAPTSVIADLIGNTVDLSWVESDAPDVDYYTVYRSTTAGFTPTAEDAIGTTTELVFSDAVTVVDEYFYKVAATDFNDNLGEFSAEVAADYLSVDVDAAPAEYSLAQNYPNPFNPTTTIHYSMKATGMVKLAVFDATGREVTTLVNEVVTVGQHQVVFRGNNLASGVYFYRLTTPGFTSMKKMLLLK